MLTTVRNILREARRIVAFTGAGISAESGIPTFRGPGGLWRTFSAEDLATPDAFRRDPKLVWEWYDWRRGLMAKAQPNPGHLALAELEQRVPRFTLITQNIDGLHDRAGSRAILKLHGDIWRLRCTGCGAETDDFRSPLPELPPRCGCGAMLRPGVVWFGEMLPHEVWVRAEEASSLADVFLTIGTSALVHPAAGLIDVARAGGAVIVEINPDATPYSDIARYSIRARAGEVLPGLLLHSE
jgi:NAD-dependent deacetylase